MKRLFWLVLFGALTGFAIGLSYSWIVAPARPADTSPATLSPVFKEQYRSAIALAYAATGNLDRARARLALLGDDDPINLLAAQAQRSLAAGDSASVAGDLASLAADLRSGVPSLRRPAPVTAARAEATVTEAGPPGPRLTNGTALGPGTVGPGQPTASATAVASISSPSPTATSVPPGPYRLVSQDQVCSRTLTAGLLQVVVVDSKGRPIPGVEIAITWQDGEEHFFTGLKPEIGLGYADYVMQPGTAYALSVGQIGAPVSSLAAPTCGQPGPNSYVGGLRLTFQQP